MTKVSIEVPDDKYALFFELMDSLGLEVEIFIPEHHKEIVRERIRNSKPEDLIPWDDVKDSL